MSTIEQKRAEMEAAVSAANTEVRNSREALSRAERRQETANARLEGFLMALEIQTTPQLPARPDKAVAGRIRKRSLKGHWRQIMQAVHGSDFGYDDLIKAASRIGHAVGKETLRSQMSGYKQAGIVESVSEGRFRLTEYGMEAAAVSEKPSANNEKGEAEASPETGKIEPFPADSQGNLIGPSAEPMPVTASDRGGSALGD